MNFSELIPLLLPQIVLLVAAFGVLATQAVGRGPAGTNPAGRWAFSSVLALAGLLLALVVLVWGTPDGRLAGGVWIVDPLTRLFQGLVLVLAFVATGLLHESPPRRHPAENLAMMLFATLGLLMIVGTEELLVMFLGLELTSLALTILAGFAQEDRRGAAAALKYFLFGSIASGFLLFGLSLVFGATGTTNLREMGIVLTASDTEPFLFVGMAMVLVGFGFKIAVVPFHLWAPDVYESAPPPAAALIASGSKVSGFFLLSKLLLVGFAPVGGSAAWGGFASGWVPMVAVLAALSMVIGNLGALAQTSVRRILAFSGIGHAGFILIALLPGTEVGLRSALFYLPIYGLATLGAFGVVAVVLRARGGDRIEDFAGLGARSPHLAASMLVFLASLAGLPPLAGFYGKFALFTAAMGAGGTVAPGAALWLVLLALLTSAISLYYYLKVAKSMFFAEGAVPVSPSTVALILVVALALALVLLGIVPNLLLAPIQSALDGSS